MSTKEQMGRLHEHHRQVFAMAEAWEKSGYAGSYAELIPA